eukprot:CAMPEP_0172390480 /NCGR_PEP_ID=MMETSP1061-20121228/7120_1 /TAXON_ID=37318 /ORGANISM="Pseudo-nitzschia pungens, Strain cf. pungens" /LENGTH=406 /DNA_ID=CAMNT_0013120871 /DNA_START=255 /DNA_END=1475 /DNA_ORIENTATION=+
MLSSVFRASRSSTLASRSRSPLTQHTQKASFWNFFRGLGDATESNTSNSNSNSNSISTRNNNSNSTSQPKDGEKPMVTITGLDGFLGPHVGLEFLKSGNYRVRATVRKNYSDKDKMNAIKEAYGEHYQDLDIVEAELLDEDSMMQAIDGSTYVAHLASPYYLDNKTRDELVGPAVQGTLSALKACTNSGVERCVFTSSYACIRWTGVEDTPRVYDESVWSNPDRPGGMSDYAVSKLLAEKAAWDYQKEHPELEVVSICPTLLLGPGIGRPNVVSEEFLKGILEDWKPSIKCASNYYSDVRDVATAHFRAIEAPGAANQRILVHSDAVSKEEIRYILEVLYGGKGFTPGVSLLDDSGAVGIVNDNSRSKILLGMEYTPIEKTLQDMADGMIESGAVGVQDDSERVVA